MLDIDQNEKKGSNKATTESSYLGPLASGLNRRAFLRTSMAISLLAGLPACKAAAPELKNLQTDNSTAARKNTFSDSQKKDIDAVQMQLFPDDGNGPSARDINGLDYLEWAMSDQQNIDDGFALAS